MLYVLLALVLLAWGLLAFDVAQYSLPVLHTNPSRWVYSCFGVLGGLSFSLVVMSYLMRGRVTTTSVSWNLRERDASYREYTEMMKEYARRYYHLLQRVDWILLTVTMVLVLGTVALPLLAFPISVFSLVTYPYVSSFLVVIDGLFMMRFIYTATPTQASEYFKWSAPRALIRAIDLLKRCPGLSWSGVVMTIGEAAGYYVIQNPRPAGRIAGIENLALVTVSLDRRGRPLTAKCVIRIQHDSDTVFEKSLADHPDSALASIVSDALIHYVNRSGDPSLVEDALDELGISGNQKTEGDV